MQHVLCEHCVGMTTRLKINPASLVFKEDRTSTWKEQYARAREFEIPEPPADDEDLEDPPFVKALAVAAGRGRLKKKRGKLGDAKREDEVPFLTRT